MRALLLCATLALGASACGTTQGASGGGDNLPVSGGGPFRLITTGEGLGFDPPRLLVDLSGDYDHPVVLRHGDELAMWLTLDKGGTASILHTDTARLEDGFEPPVLALAADQSWEGDRVFGPSVVEGDPWLLFYATGLGTIGVATAADGHAWQKQSAPIFAPAGRSVTLPSAVQLGDRIRLYYQEAGVLWAVEAPRAAVVAGAPTWVEIDGDGRTAQRDPMLIALPFSRALGRVHARAEETPGDRLRHDLFVGVTNLEDKPAAGFAASFTGSTFEAFALPIAAVGVTSPMAIPDGQRALLFAVQSYLDHRVIVVGESP